MPRRRSRERGDKRWLTEKENAAAADFYVMSCAAHVFARDEHFLACVEKTRENPEVADKLADKLACRYVRYGPGRAAIARMLRTAAGCEPRMVETALAIPRNAIPGKFTIGFGAGDLSKRLKASNVWCGWVKDRVIVHINLKNTAVEHVTATIQPSYTIKGGSKHGAGFSSLENYGFDAGEFRSLWIKEEPKGTKVGSPLSRCSPSLFSIKAG